MNDAGERHLQADLDHQVLEDLPILAAEDRFAVGADHLHVVLLKNALIEAGHAGVQAGLPAEGREQRIDRMCRLRLRESRIFSTASGVIGSM